MKTRAALLIPAVSALSLVPLSAATVAVEAFNNATVQTGGPRSGSSGKAFFNIEGSSNGTFASYGVADFTVGSLGAVTGITSATVSLTQSNASFTTDGSLELFLDASPTLSNIESGTSPLAFDGSDPGTDTDAGDGDLVLIPLGTVSFTQTATGDVDVFNLALSPLAEAELLTRLNTSDTIRVVFGTGDATVAATYAGYSNTTYDGPTLTLTYVPEPSTGLLAAGALGLLFLRKRSAQGPDRSRVSRRPYRADAEETAGLIGDARVPEHGVLQAAAEGIRRGRQAGRHRPRPGEIIRGQQLVGNAERILRTLQPDGGVALSRFFRPHETDLRQVGDERIGGQGVLLEVRAAIAIRIGLDAGH
ncbi:PEP-CTERM sorting domain-containing protein [Haloferula sargassicola]|uniref:PEP-CTERM sorting domain-containing protein n=1 Tax=Haloferula sargassicola TaxID=490096 RepID=UPI003365384B